MNLIFTYRNQARRAILALAILISGISALAATPAAYAAGNITVGEVIRALEGPISIVSCLDHGGCPQEPRCNLRRPVQKLQAAITQMLDTMSLAELTNEDVPDLLSIRA